MKQDTDELYAVQSYDIEDLEGLPYRQQISPSITQYSTNDESDMSNIVRNAAEHDQRVQFFVHDAGSNLLIPIGANTGHSPGFDPDYFIDQGVPVRDALEEFSAAEVGEIEIDWVLIDVIDNWRNPR